MSIFEKTTTGPKGKLAEKLSQRMGCYSLEYHPTAFSEDFDSYTERESKGHLFYIAGNEHGEFPDFGFEVWVDDRDNNGDLPQTIVDKLHSIAEQYREVAERVALRLNRQPSK
ncbi:hypothetical protein [Aeoliella sp. SH292]|uniref:hypothetical protein n=1 Tax=Aeoliella sp. SH292 TaxID=3454464 RepID=UPI003F9C712E